MSLPKPRARVTNANIQTVLGERQQARAERVEVTQDLVLQTILRNVGIAMGDVPTPEGFRVWEGAVANRALELLGKHLGMFSDRIRHEACIEKPVQFIVMPPAEPDMLGDDDD